MITFCESYCADRTDQEVFKLCEIDPNKVVHCRNCKWSGSYYQCSLQRRVPFMNDPRLVCPGCKEEEMFKELES